MDVAPFRNIIRLIIRRVAKASTGHVPQPFLIRYFKNFYEAKLVQLVECPNTKGKKVDIILLFTPVLPVKA